MPASSRHKTAGRGGAAAILLERWDLQCLKACESEEDFGLWKGKRMGALPFGYLTRAFFVELLGRYTTFPRGPIQVCQVS